MKEDQDTTKTIKLNCDSQPLVQAMDELTACINELDDLTRERFKRFFDRPDFLLELFTVDTVFSTTPADKCLVRFNPTDRFHMLLAAVRAGDVDGVLVE